eukprot:GGOE01001490.1.p1 GENE.GGOE01001490.1~~GGOE01001490.1.p1  ORF type:complete len:570 (-),score=185.07 GGOE01001490.1:186-1895(-)
MARLLRHFGLLVVFGLGYLSCFMFLHSSAEEDPSALSPGVEAVKAIDVPLCPPEPTPPSEAHPNVSQVCTCEEAEDEMLAYNRMLEAEAAECIDDIAKQRMGIPMICPVLARCAVQWIVRHDAPHWGPQRAQSLLDYGYDAMEYGVAEAVSKDWLFLAAFLPQDTIALPTKRGMPRNLVFLAPPILHRLKAFFQTPTLLDFQFALRVDELLTYATPISILDLIGRILAMAKTSYLVLPCTGISDMTDATVVAKAVEHVLALGRQRTFGVKELEVEVERVTVFRYRTCTRPLLRVTVKSLKRRVRKKWCFYPFEGATYTLQYRKGEAAQLVVETAKGAPTEIPHRSPSVGVAEVIGWGMLRDQREVMTWDMLQHPNAGQPSVHNWVVAAGGRVGQREPLGGDEAVGRPMGIQYVDFLRLEMCTFGPIEQGIKFRQVVGDTPQGRQLVFLSRTKNFQFINGTMYSASGGGWKVREQSMPDVGDCRVCTACLAHPFPVVEPSADKATVPKECEQCYACQYDRFLGHGMPLSRIFVGCTDVEGVMENSAKPPELCDDTQHGHLRRPSEMQAST